MKNQRLLHKKSTGLMVVDIQGWLAERVDGSDELIANTCKLIQGAIILGLPIVWLEQNTAKLGATTPVISKLLEAYTPIEKFTFDGCKTATVMQEIEQIKVKNWLVCGIEAHICVYQTARSLYRAGFGVEVVTDCIAARSSTNTSLAINKLSALGVGLTGLEMCLFELLEDCRVAEFKRILKLIK